MNGRAVRRRPVLAVVLSFVLVVVGIAVIACGVLIPVTAVVEAVETADVLNWVFALLLVGIGLGFVLAGVRFITRLRPWVVRRLAGCEVPRIPRPIAWLATADSGG